MRFAEHVLADVAIKHLEKSGHKVYTEVPLVDSRIDIVATKGKLITCVEVKGSMGLAVLRQAVDRAKYANISVACTHRPKTIHDNFAVLNAVCKNTGIGIWLIKNCPGSGLAIDEFIPPRVVPANSPGMRFSLLRSKLHEGMIGQPAGTQGGHWTPFKETCLKLKCVVEKRPGIRILDAVREIPHHYSSDYTARRCLQALIVARQVDGVTYLDGQLFPSSSK